METEMQTDMTQAVVNSLLNQIAQAALREANKDALIAELSTQLESLQAPSAADGNTTQGE